MTVVVLGVEAHSETNESHLGEKRTFPLTPAYSAISSLQGAISTQLLVFVFFYINPLSFGPPSTHHQYFLPIPLCLAAHFAENVANFRKLAAGQSPLGSPVLHITNSTGVKHVSLKATLLVND